MRIPNYFKAVNTFFSKMVKKFFTEIWNYCTGITLYYHELLAVR